MVRLTGLPAISARLGVETHGKIANMDQRFSVTSGPTHDRLHAGDELVLVKRLGQVIVGSIAQTFDPALDPGQARQDQDRCLDPGKAQAPQDFVAGHVRQVQVEENDVVIVELAEIEALLAQLGREQGPALLANH